MRPLAATVQLGESRTSLLILRATNCRMGKPVRLGYRFREMLSSLGTESECFNRKKSGQSRKLMKLGKRRSKFRNCSNETILFLSKGCRRNRNAGMMRNDYAKLLTQGKSSPPGMSESKEMSLLKTNSHLQVKWNSRRWTTKQRCYLLKLSLSLKRGKRADR